MTTLELTNKTALGPNEPDDGDEGRRQRGLAIAAQVPINRNRLGYEVPSQSDNGSYVVNLDGEPFCTCRDFAERQEPCKHIYATSFALKRETYKRDTLYREQAREEVRAGARQTTEEKLRVKTTQADFAPAPEDASYWQIYNLAQTNEKDMFYILLKSLCDTLVEPPKEGRGKGRPKLPLGDTILSCALKVYLGESGRKNEGFLRDAVRAGLLEKYPSFTTVFRYMEDEALTPILHKLIETSSLPLKALETGFAPDGSGFSTSVHDRWFDDKWGSGRTQKKAHARYLKAHLICGVETQIVSKVVVTEAESHDGQHLPELVKATAKNFEVQEVMADKAYLSAANLRLISEVGATPLIPFKVNSKPRYNEGRNQDTEEANIWNQCYHYFMLHREEFLKRYHKRSNVESAYSMIKKNYGGALSSKRETAQVNEILLKVVCHNVGVLIKSFYKLGIKAEFLPDRDLALAA